MDINTNTSMALTKANTTQHIRLCAMSKHEQKSTSSPVHEVAVYVCMQLCMHVYVQISVQGHVYACVQVHLV